MQYYDDNIIIMIRVVVCDSDVAVSDDSDKDMLDWIWTQTAPSDLTDSESGPGSRGRQCHSPGSVRNHYYGG